MKKAIQRLIRGDDGKLKIVFIDAVTLKQLPNSQGYQVINSNADQYWEPVQSVDKPNVPSATTSIQDLNPEINSHGTDRQSELGITTSSKPPESLARQSVRESLKPSSSSTRVSPESSVRALAVNPDISPSVSTASRVNPESVQERQVSETNPEIAKSIPGEVNPLGIGNTPTGLARLDYSGLAGKQRNQKPNADFMRDIQDSVTGFFGPGYTVNVESGKGYKKGANANHPFGVAADFTVEDPQGKQVSPKRMEDYGVYAASEMGKKFTGVGIGPGYMSPGEMHLDKRHKSITGWGAGGVGSTMNPETKAALEQTGRVGAPVFGMGMPEYMGTTPTPRPEDQSVAKKTIASVAETPSNYDQAQSNPLGKFDSVTSSRPGFTGIVGADGKQYGLTGDMATRNNNPGNLVANDWSGAIGTNTINPTHSFAVYGTPEEGAAARKALLSGPKYSSLSLYDAMHKYAPPADDNNTLGYIEHLTKTAGVPSSKKIADMSQTEFNGLLSGISSWESKKTPVDVTDSLGRHIGSYFDGRLTRDPTAEGYYTDRGSLGDTPSETSGIGRGSRVGGSYSGRTGVDSPSEDPGRFGGTGLGSDYSGKGGLDSPSESARSSGGFKGSSKGSGFASGGSDKEKDRSLDRDSGKKDHSKGGYNAD